MLRITIAVHQHDGQGTIAGIEGGLKIRAHARGIRCLQHVAVRADAFVDFDHARVEQFRQHDMAVENPRPVLIGDAQSIAKAARDCQCRGFAFALEQRVGCHRGSHFDGVDAVGRNCRIRRDAQQVFDAGDRGVCILRGVFRQQFMRDEFAVRAAADHVGEGAAAVDPELPARRCGLHGYDGGEREAEHSSRAAMRQYARRPRLYSLKNRRRARRRTDA